MYPWATTNSFIANNNTSGTGAILGTAAATSHVDHNHEICNPQSLEATSSTWLTSTTSSDDAAIIGLPSYMSLSLHSLASLPNPISPAMLALLQELTWHNTAMSPLSPLSELAIASSTTDGPINADVSWDEGPITSNSYYQLRCEYASQRFVAQANALAEVGHTTFIHHSQIQTSAVLQDALSSSALNTIRNTSNNAVVRNLIGQRATLLVDAVDAVITQSAFTQIDLLPPIQALLIYQCLRLFCMNDISQRSQAEGHELRLKAWLQILRRQLRPIRDNLEWATWVREESMRRTVFFAEMLIAVHCFLKHGWDRAEARLAPLSFTAQVALWEAQSAAEWERAWIALPRREIRMMTLDQDLALVTPADAEESTVVLRAIHYGLDEVGKWLGGDGEVLRRWGLRT